MRNIPRILTVLALIVLTPMVPAPRAAWAQECESGQGLDLVNEGFEAGSGGWTPQGTGSPGWTLSQARSNIGNWSAFASSPTSPTDRHLRSPSLFLPATDTFLSFWHWRSIEDAPDDECSDGGVLEISTNGGASYTRLESQLINTTYDGPIRTDTGNPLAGEDAWCGIQGWNQVFVDLTSFSGKTAFIRFRMVTDNETGREGWYVDDIFIESCGVIFFDGFESGTTTNWSDVE